MKFTSDESFSICLMIGLSAQSAPSPLASQFMCRARKMQSGENLDLSTQLFWFLVFYQISCSSALSIVHHRGHLVVKHDSLGEILLQATEISEARQVVIECLLSLVC